MILLGLTSVIILAVLVAGDYLDLIDMRKQQEQNAEVNL